MTPYEIALILLNPSLEGLCRIATMKGQWVIRGNYEEAAYYRDIEKELIAKLKAVVKSAD